MGGESAAIDATESVTGMRTVIEQAGNDRAKYNGSFHQYDGAELHW
jgi:hypothetical protein